ncbi:hypothetical protein J2X84_000001, partial [Pseudomonas corrugata]|uniref:hypothetical protein n=1 Tax=Pseudomonas corrugata TaxID=47879 RepID=UPI00285DFB12
KLRNSLFTKEFSVSTAPEVGRIIDIQNLPSSIDLASLSITCKKAENNPIPLYIEEQTTLLYIERILKAPQTL